MLQSTAVATSYYNPQVAAAIAPFPCAHNVNLGQQHTLTACSRWKSRAAEKDAPTLVGGLLYRQQHPKQIREALTTKFGQ